MVKRIFTLAMAMFVASSACFATNCAKDSKKQAKTLKKEGWLVPPGSLTVERQCERYCEMINQYDDNGYSKFIEGSAMSVGRNYDAAKMQAIDLAKNQIASSVSSEIAGLVESELANTQLEPGEAESTVETVQATKTKISASLGRVIIVQEFYRELENKNKEVRVVILYNAEMAKAVARKVVKQELEKKGNKLAGQLDKMLGF